MRTETINIYKIDEHPDKDKCFEWIRNNDYHIGDFEVEDLICSIRKLSEAIGGTRNWSIAHYPCQGEHITFKDYDEELLAELVADDCPLTGCFWDGVVIDALKAKNMRDVLDTLHKSIEHLYSDEALTEMCEANDYEFYIGGEMV
tara:strand:- start:108 stop:542 length:435 start_codon:yes stop_codon:yes gene_type:complete